MRQRKFVALRGARGGDVNWRTTWSGVPQTRTRTAVRTLGRRMDRRETVAQLLNAFGVTFDKPLGAGQESDVFAIDDRRVLRLYRRPCDERHLARLATFYARLDRRDAPFMVPRIIEFGERDGIAYAVEVRVSGMDLAKALARMKGEERFYAIRNYVDAATAVRSLKYPQVQFGEVIAANPVRRDTRAEFVVARAVQCLDEHRHLLIGVLERPERGIPALEAGLASRDHKIAYASCRSADRYVIVIGLKHCLVVGICQFC
jgi:hypothetical protein